MGEAWVSSGGLCICFSYTYLKQCYSREWPNPTKLFPKWCSSADIASAAYCRGMSVSGVLLGVREHVLPCPRIRLCWAARSTWTYDSSIALGQCPSQVRSTEGPKIWGICLKTQPILQPGWSGREHNPSLPEWTETRQRGNKSKKSLLKGWKNKTMEGKKARDNNKSLIRCKGQETSRKLNTWQSS